MRRATTDTRGRARIGVPRRGLTCVDAGPDSKRLLAVAAYARTALGPTIECGSGLTTLVLGLYAPDGTWTLEYNPLWRWEFGITCKTI